MLLALVFVKPTFAVDSTVSSAATPSAAKVTPVEKKAQDLLDRVATKVAQIADSDKRTYHGVIKSVGTETYTITTSEGDRQIATNDATEFFRIKASKKSETDFAGIKKGEDIVVIGTIDPATKTMTAKQIITKIKRTVFAGPITAVEKNIITINGTKIDLSDASYEQMDADGKITVAKVSDFQTGKTAFVLAHSPEDEVYSSLKALVIQ